LKCRRVLLFAKLAFPKTFSPRDFILLRFCAQIPSSYPQNRKLRSDVFSLFSMSSSSSLGLGFLHSTTPHNGLAAGGQ
jgi:hypothetical protein